jgi:hypothetical protein
MCVCKKHIHKMYVKVKYVQKKQVNMHEIQDGPKVS